MKLVLSKCKSEDEMLTQVLELSYALKRFVDISGNTRFIPTHKKTGAPSICLSMYEQEQLLKAKSYNSTAKLLYELIYLYTWTDLNSIDLDVLLLNGQGFSEIQIRQFVQWLRNYITRKNSALTTKVFNSILLQCSSFLYGAESGKQAGQQVVIQQLLIKLQMTCWRAFKIDHLCALNFDQAFIRCRLLHRCG